jgi:hypothetical protein
MTGLPGTGGAAGMGVGGDGRPPCSAATSTPNTVANAASPMNPAARKAKRRRTRGESDGLRCRPRSDDSRAGLTSTSRTSSSGPAVTDCRVLLPSDAWLNRCRGPAESTGVTLRSPAPLKASMSKAGGGVSVPSQATPTMATSYPCAIAVARVRRTASTISCKRHGYSSALARVAATKRSSMAPSAVRPRTMTSSILVGVADRTSDTTACDDT